MSHVGENIEHVHDLVMSDRSITTRIITDKLAISNGSVQTILKEDLKLWAAKNWILHHGNAPSHLALIVL
jgi:hypothetical protein